MHIILGLLGTIVTILILLNRLAQAGIDLGGLNPYLWHRRRKWRQQYQGNPLYRLESPMDSTAVLIVAAAKADGDVAREEKTTLLRLFESEFNLSKKDAAGLLISSVHLLGDGVELRANLSKFLSASLGSFTEEQAGSALTLIARMAGDPEVRHENAEQLLREVEKVLKATPSKNQTW